MLVKFVVFTLYRDTIISLFLKRDEVAVITIVIYTVHLVLRNDDIKEVRTA